jgi:uncharacterized protein YukE
MDVRDYGQIMGWTALGEAVFASCVIPATLMVVIEIGLLISNPGGMAGAAKDWKDVATQVESLKNELDTLANGVPPEKWQGQDRQSFGAALTKYKAELTKAHDFHGYVGDMLDIVSWVFFALAAAALTFATILAVNAALILLAGGSIIGILGIPFLEAEANTVATWITTMISTMSLSTKVLIGAVMAIIAAGSLSSMPLQKKLMNPNGNGPVMFQQATLTMGTPALPANLTTPAPTP